MKKYVVEVTETMTKKIIIKIPEDRSIEEFYEDICEDVNTGHGEMNIDEYADDYNFNRDWRIIEDSKEKDFTTLPVIEYGKE